MDTIMPGTFFTLRVKNPETGVFASYDGNWNFHVEVDAEHQLEITPHETFKNQCFAVYLWNMDDYKPEFPYIIPKNETLCLRWLWDKKRFKVGRYHLSVQYYEMEGSCLSTQFTGSFNIVVKQ
jgi:hypothetical protein